MEPDREQPPTKVEGLRAETGKLKTEAAGRMAEARRFDNNTTLDVYKVVLAVFASVVAGTKVAGEAGLATVGDHVGQT